LLILYAINEIVISFVIWFTPGRLTEIYFPMERMISTCEYLEKNPPSETLGRIFLQIVSHGLSERRSGKIEHLSLVWSRVRVPGGAGDKNFNPFRIDCIIAKGGE
jgi:hypothetical protein